MMNNSSIFIIVGGLIIMVLARISWHLRDIAACFRDLLAELRKQIT